MVETSLDGETVSTYRTISSTPYSTWLAPNEWTSDKMYYAPIDPCGQVINTIENQEYYLITENYILPSTLSWIRLPAAPTNTDEYKYIKL